VNNKTIASVKLLGSKEKLTWKQEGDALVIDKPAQLPEWQVATLKIEFKE